MHDILLDIVIKSKPVEIFPMFSQASGLNKWWTKEATSDPVVGGKYRFHFSPDYDWQGIVTKYQQDDYIEWKMEDSQEDWLDTRVGCQLFLTEDNNTLLKFYHTGWKSQNDHFRRSSYFWASYLRLLKRFIENDEFVPYEHRNQA